MIALSALVFCFAQDESAKARYLGPKDFRDSTLSIPLRQTAGGRSILVVVPGISSLRWLEGSRNLSARMQVTVESDRATSGIPGLRLPNRPRLGRRKTESRDPREKKPPPRDRVFRVYHQKRAEYVEAAGRIAFEGDLYSFYEDPANGKNFTREQYELLDKSLNERFASLTEWFGSPADSDGNGRILVYISRTVAESHPHGQAYVDGADAEVGEIVYFWSPDRLALAEPVGYFARNILHETVHLCQNGRSLRKHRKFVPLPAPSFLLEGSAELPRHAFSLTVEEKWTSIRGYLLSLDRLETTPFNYDYHFGGLLSWWMHQSFGDGVHQALLDAIVDSKGKDRDSIERALGIPEPLMLALMYASLFFDGSEFGRESGLHFPQEDIPARLGRAMPATTLTMGEKRVFERGYTGGLILEVAHQKPARVTLEVTDSDRAYVILAQP